MDPTTRAMLDAAREKRNRGIKPPPPPPTRPAATVVAVALPPRPLAVSTVEQARTLPGEAVQGDVLVLPPPPGFSDVDDIDTASTASVDGPVSAPFPLIGLSPPAEHFRERAHTASPSLTATGNRHGSGGVETAAQSRAHPSHVLVKAAPGCWGQPRHGCTSSPPPTRRHNRTRTESSPPPPPRRHSAGVGVGRPLAGPPAARRASDVHDVPGMREAAAAGPASFETESINAHRQDSGHRRPLYIWEAPGTLASALKQRHEELARIKGTGAALNAEWEALTIAIARQEPPLPPSLHPFVAPRRGSAAVEVATARPGSSDPSKVPTIAMTAPQSAQDAEWPVVRPSKPGVVATAAAASRGGRSGEGADDTATESDTIPLKVSYKSRQSQLMLDASDFSELSSDDTYDNITYSPHPSTPRDPAGASASATITDTAGMQSQQGPRRVARPAPPPPDYNPASGPPPSVCATRTLKKRSWSTDEEPAPDLSHGARPPASTAGLGRGAVASHDREVRAAVVIQSNWRGRSVRKKMSIVHRRQIAGQLPTRAVQKRHSRGVPLWPVFAAGHPTQPLIGQGQHPWAAAPIRIPQANGGRNLQGVGGALTAHSPHSPHSPHGPHSPRFSTSFGVPVSPGVTIAPGIASQLAPQRSLSSVTPQALPPGWASAVDPHSGKTYFYHAGLGKTQWHHPQQIGVTSSPPTPR